MNKPEPMTDPTFTTFCLGGPMSMKKCKTCQHEKNWDALNQMPDPLRKMLQKRMRQIDESGCALTSGCYYEPEQKSGEQK